MWPGGRFFFITTRYCAAEIIAIWQLQHVLYPYVFIVLTSVIRPYLAHNEGEITTEV